MVLTPGIWKSAKNGAFQDATKWTAGVVPSALDDALITAAGGAFTVTSSADTTVNAFSLSSNATLAITSDSTFTAAHGTAGVSSYTDFGAIKVWFGSTLNIGDAFTESGGRIYSAGVTNFASGTNIALSKNAVIATEGGIVNLTDDTITSSDSAFQLRAGSGARNTLGGSSVGGTLNITGSTVTGGSVLARYALTDHGTDVVNLTDDTLNNVYFDSYNGGVINVLGSTSSFNGATNTADIEVRDGASLTLSGAINNVRYYTSSGIFLDAGSGSSANTELLINGATTLRGGGVVSLSDNLSNVIDGAVSGGDLDNVNNTISGAGFIGVGDGSLTLENSGVIKANGVAGLFIDTSRYGAAGDVSNTGGSLEAFGVGGLHFSANTNVTGGTAEISAGSSLELQKSTDLGVTFLDNGASASLTLDTSIDQSFSSGGSTIAFGAGSNIHDALNLAGLAFTSTMSETYTPIGGSLDVLSVSNGRATVNLDIVDQGYSLANFSLSKFTAGGLTGATVTFSS